MLLTSLYIEPMPGDEPTWIGNLRWYSLVDFYMTNGFQFKVLNPEFCLFLGVQYYKAMERHDGMTHHLAVRRKAGNSCLPEATFL